MKNYLSKSNVHTHTTFSDGKNSAEDMVQRALSLGFHTLGFSEHSPAIYDDAAMPARREPKYRAEILRLREKYAGQIELLIGLEHDWLSPAVPKDCDFWIESVHYVRSGGWMWSVDWDRQRLEDARDELCGGDIYALCQDYFRTVSESIQKTGADILGHIELIMKFNEARDLFDDTDARYLGPALECATLAAESGRLIEINSGAVAKGYRTAPYPGEAMLRRACEAGGRVILTSDCHDMAFLDCHFAESAALAKACGFRTAWEYRGNQLIEYPL